MRVGDAEARGNHRSPEDPRGRDRSGRRDEDAEESGRQGDVGEQGGCAVRGRGGDAGAHVRCGLGGLGGERGQPPLGQTNVANALTRLTGSVPGAQMEVQNNDPGANDTALSLKVQPGEPPMKVLSGAKVENLNADELDGLDPSQIKGARAYAVVDPDDGPGGTPGFDPSAPSGFNSVQRISTGIYCLKAPGLIPKTTLPW